MFSGVRPSVRSSVRPSVCYQTRERDTLKTNEPTLMPIGSSGPRGKGVKRSTSGVRRTKIKNRFGGLAEAPFFSTPLGCRAAFLVC